MAKTAKGSAAGSRRSPRTQDAKATSGAKRRGRAGGQRSADGAGPARAGQKASARPRGTTPRRPRTAPRGGAGARVETGPAIAAEPPRAGAADLGEEDAIRSAKFLPRELPRVFEEERFLFPENYGVNRVRLLVKDPDWLFAHWDVRAASIDDLRREIGERALALSRLTLRISDPVNGGSSDILLPYGARSWYVHTDPAPRSYKAELGMTLPSGAFRRLAESNVVVSPRVGPSPARARRRVRYGSAVEESLAAAEDASAESPGPLSAPSIDGGLAAPAEGPGSEAARGGASDAFRPPGGASDAFRR